MQHVHHDKGVQAGPYDINSALKDFNIDEAPLTCSVLLNI